MTDNKTTILTTGGTGGHIFPAQAVAKKLTELGFRVIIFGDKNYVKYHKDNSYQFKIICSSQLIKSPLALVKAGIKITCGILQSLFLLLKYRPQKIVAFGGYSTFPVLIAAVILKKEIILHEQNAHLGKVNRIFAKYASKIALSYQQTDGISLQQAGPSSQSKIAILPQEEDSSSPCLVGDFERQLQLTKQPKMAVLSDQGLDERQREQSEGVHNKLIFTGNPIRDEILALSKCEYQLPDLNQSALPVENLGYDVLLASQFYKYNQSQIGQTFNILVIGGSGGAKIFSDILPKAFFNIRDELKNQIHITQQCRAENLSATFEQYKSFNIDIEISHFFENMAEKISEAHLVIARSGSSSIAEFTAAKKPMILVPFAKSADNHQEKNALAIEKSGGAIVIKEQDFTINNLTATLEKLIDNPAILQRMSDSAFKFANLDAATNLTKLIIA